MPYACGELFRHPSARGSSRGLAIFRPGREQRADLEEPRRNVEGPGDAGPLFEISQPGPAGDAVVDDEEAAARGVSVHSVLPAGARRLDVIVVRLHASSIGLHLDPRIDSRSTESPLAADLETKQIAFLDEAVHGLVRHLEEAGYVGDGEDVILARYIYPIGANLWKTFPDSRKIWKILESVKEISSTEADPHHDQDGCSAGDRTTGSGFQ